MGTIEQQLALPWGVACRLGLAQARPEFPPQLHCLEQAPLVVTSRPPFHAATVCEFLHDGNAFLAGHQHMFIRQQLFGKAHNKPAGSVQYTCCSPNYHQRSSVADRLPHSNMSTLGACRAGTMRDEQTAAAVSPFFGQDGCPFIPCRKPHKVVQQQHLLPSYFTLGQGMPEKHHSVNGLINQTPRLVMLTYLPDR